MSLYPLGKALTYVFVRLCFRMRYEGLENIPREQGFLLASNHRSVLDPLFVAHKVPQELSFMAKAELFRNPFFGGLIRRLNAFPIRRGAGDTEAMDTARGVITHGGVLVVFPEGHRSKDGKPQRGRSGVALLSAQTSAPVLPCAVIYGSKLRFRTVITVRYGKLITTDEMGCSTESPSTIRAAAKRVMDAIVELLEREDRPCR